MYHHMVGRKHILLHNPIWFGIQDLLLPSSLKPVHSDLSTSLLAGNSSRVDLRRSLHHSQRLHVTDSPASLPSSGDGEGQNWAGCRGTWLRIPQKSRPNWGHHGERGGCRKHRDNLPAERRLSESPESQWRFSSVPVSYTVSEPGQAEPAPVRRLCHQRGPPLPTTSLRWLPDSPADIWIRRKFKYLAVIYLTDRPLVWVFFSWAEDVMHAQ